MTESTAMQFDSLRQQRLAGTAGMWVFLASEILFFGALFLLYAAYRYHYPEAFVIGSGELNTLLATVNTALLLTSSLFIALGQHSVSNGALNAGRIWLCLTLVLGVSFLGLKAVEYWQEYRHGLLPFADQVFVWQGQNPAHGKLFFNLYFTVTALHALHLLIGCLAVGGLLVYSWRGRDAQALMMPVTTVGLYWHFVDIVWVFVYPLFYLIR